MPAGFRFTFDLRGHASEQVRKAAAVALGDAAEFLLEQANRTIPHEEGTLERSGVASVDEKALRAAVSYDTPYAVRQHEDTRLRHDEGRRAKWLEATFKEKAAKVGEFLAGRIKAAI